jgi:hypothetical protein
VTLTTPAGQLHHYMRSYKRGHVEARREHSRVVASLLARFLAGHRHCIAGVAGRRWFGVVVVPSSRAHPGPHPLETALGRLGWQETMISPLCRGPGQLGHLKASDDAYRVTRRVVGMALLLIDDTMTSSAHMQSAASALQIAGAEVVAAVPVARYLDPVRGKEPVRALLARAGAATYDFETCCIEHETPLRQW